MKEKEREVSGFGSQMVVVGGVGRASVTLTHVE